jgi:hypothetical protein
METLPVTSYSKSLLPRKKIKHVLDMDLDELVKQMTLIQINLFLKIQPWELLKQEWNNKKRVSRAIHVKKLNLLSTQVSHYLFQNN